MTTATTAKALLADEKALDDLTDDAINAVALLVQNKIGQDDGGVAGLHFSDTEERDPIKEALRRYLKREAFFEERAR